MQNIYIFFIMHSTTNYTARSGNFAVVAGACISEHRAGCKEEVACYKAIK